MRPEHVAANELIDIARTGDRSAYKAQLAAIEGKFSPAIFQSIKSQAAMQYRMETKDCRYTSWRSDWLTSKREKGHD